MTNSKPIIRTIYFNFSLLAAILTICILFLVTTQTSKLLAQNSEYGYNYYNKPMEPGKYYSAKDYWKAKRDALKKGNKKYNSASHQPREDEDKPSDKKTSTDGKPKTTDGPSSDMPVNQDLPNDNSTPPTNYTTSKPTIIPSIYSGQAKTMEEFELSSCRQIMEKTIGSPYAETGQSVETGFSSTGLVSYVFTSLGYKIADTSPKNLWQHTGLFTDSSLNEAQSGDILFFKLFSQKEGKSKIAVAICFDKNEMLYPSFTAKKVIKRSSSNTFWRNRYIGAKRVLTGK